MRRGLLILLLLILIILAHLSQFLGRKGDR